MRGLLRKVSPLEWAVAGFAAAILVVLVVVEPDILDAPFASTRAVVFTFGGTILAAIVLIALVRWHVHPVVRVLVLGVPFVLVQWWLISPFFVDEVVDDDFDTSIAAAQREQAGNPVTPTTERPDDTSAATSTSRPDPGPLLLGSGMFVGLAGHEGRGDAGVFRLADQRQVLRFENFDIENGPDLELYVVPGLEQRSLGDGSIHLGALRGNVGDQTYDLPGNGLAPGEWTVLVWCDAFDVEFVAASLTVA
jgi:hypothetical protein